MLNVVLIIIQKQKQQLLFTKQFKINYIGQLQGAQQVKLL